MAHDVFVSYPHVDKPIADAVVATLEGRGVRCWVAPRDVPPGADWAGSIVDAIEASRLVVLVFSSTANESEHILREVRAASDADVGIVPFRTAEVEPNSSLRYYLGGMHWLDALSEPIEAHLEVLGATVARLLGIDVVVPRPAPASVRPERDVTASAPDSGPMRPRPGGISVAGWGFAVAAALALVVGIVIAVVLRGDDSGDPSAAVSGEDPGLVADVADGGDDSAEPDVVADEPDAVSTDTAANSGEDSAPEEAGDGAGPSPDHVLISDTRGVLWSYDIASGDVSEFAAVESGNYDIQFFGPDSILIANINGSVRQLDLSDLQETLAAEYEQLTSPIGVAVAAGGFAYFADLVEDNQSVGRIFLWHPNAGGLELMLTTSGGVEDVAVDEDGLVYFTSGSRLGRFDPSPVTAAGPSPDPIRAEEIANIHDSYLNGLVVTPTGRIYVASTGSSTGDVGGVFRVEVSTGEVTPVHVGEPLRNPEDVALAPNGDLYVIDSAHLQAWGNPVPALYRIAPGGDIETLYEGEPFDDVVDILLSP